MAQGPEGGYHFSHPYYWLDVTEFPMRAQIAWRATATTRAAQPGVGQRRQPVGLMLRLEVTYPDRDGGVRDGFLLESAPLQAFSERETGYQTQFLEHIDMHQMPVGGAGRL